MTTWSVQSHVADWWGWMARSAFARFERVFRWLLPKTANRWLLNKKRRSWIGRNSQWYDRQYRANFFHRWVCIGKRKMDGGAARQDSAHAANLASISPAEKKKEKTRCYTRIYCRERERDGHYLYTHTHHRYTCTTQGIYYGCPVIIKVWSSASAVFWYNNNNYNNNILYTRCLIRRGDMSNQLLYISQRENKWRFPCRGKWT